MEPVNKSGMNIPSQTDKVEEKAKKGKMDKAVGDVLPHDGSSSKPKIPKKRMESALNQEQSKQKESFANFAASTLKEINQRKQTFADKHGEGLIKGNLAKSLENLDSTVKEKQTSIIFKEKA